MEGPFRGRYDSYISFMQQESSWGDELTCLACSHLLRSHSNEFCGQFVFCAIHVPTRHNLERVMGSTLDTFNVSQKKQCLSSRLYMATLLCPHFQQNLIKKELNQDLILSKVCGASGRYARELALEFIPHVRAAWMVAKDEKLRQDSILIDSCIHSLPSTTN